MIRDHLIRNVQVICSVFNLNPTEEEIHLYCYNVAKAIEGGMPTWQNPIPGEAPITPGDVADWLVTDEIGIRASFFRWLKRNDG